MNKKDETRFEPENHLAGFRKSKSIMSEEDANDFNRELQEMESRVCLEEHETEIATKNIFVTGFTD